MGLFKDSRQMGAALLTITYLQVMALTVLKTPAYLRQSSPTSASRLGKPPVQRPNPGRSSVIHGNEMIHIKLQHGSFGYGPGNAHSPGGSSFNNATPWGRKTNPLVNIPPPSRERKDYRRIV